MRELKNKRNYHKRSPVGMIAFLVTIGSKAGICQALFERNPFGKVLRENYGLEFEILGFVERIPDRIHKVLRKCQTDPESSATTDLHS